jgi:hypothetical protein
MNGQMKYSAAIPVNATFVCEGTDVWATEDGLEIFGGL